MKLYKNHKSAYLRMAVLALAGTFVLPAVAQKFTVTEAQRAQANATLAAGIPVSELAPNAPDVYAVKLHDTLWRIAGIYLRSPWRWPELWGMNLDGIRNPHLIYPGQNLYLIKKDGRATLGLAPSAAQTQSNIPTVPTTKLSPRIRPIGPADNAIPTLQMSLIAPFLVEPVVVETSGLDASPRIVALAPDRAMASAGDRVYVRSSAGQTMADPVNSQVMMRVYRNPKPLMTPGSEEILGYEAAYLGRVQVLRGEKSQVALDAPAGSKPLPVPGTVLVVSNKEEMRVGDRLMAESKEELLSFVPKAPDKNIVARAISIYGSAFANASKNQVLAINKGSRDGLVRGDVLAILTKGEEFVDRTHDSKDLVRLPSERKGLAMVFRVFDKVSYVLVLESADAIQSGDLLVNPK
jgi:LysM domain